MRVAVQWPRNLSSSMQIFRHLGDPAVQVRPSVVTLGNFDGIHLGHQALIEGAVADAKQLGRCSIVLTFEPHPLRVLAPERAPKMLLTHKDKMQLFQAFGVDAVIVQHFDPVFQQCAFMRTTRLILFNARGKKLPSILQGLTCLSNYRANPIESDARPALGAQSPIQPA